MKVKIMTRMMLITAIAVLCGPLSFGQDTFGPFAFNPDDSSAPARGDSDKLPAPVRNSARSLLLVPDNGKAAKNSKKEVVQFKMASGFLLEDDFTVMTARHNLYDAEPRIFAEQLITVSGKFAKGDFSAAQNVLVDLRKPFPFFIVDINLQDGTLSMLYDNENNPRPAKREFYLDPVSTVLHRLFQNKQEQQGAISLYYQTDFEIIKIADRLKKNVGPLRLAKENPKVGSPIYIPSLQPERQRFGGLEVSVGRVLGVRDGILFHNAEAIGSSAGSPILNSDGEVVAMQTLLGSDAKGMVVRGGPSAENIREYRKSFSAFIKELEADPGIRKP